MHLLECLKFRGLSTLSVGKRVEELEHFWQENETLQLLWKEVWQL